MHVKAQVRKAIQSRLVSAVPALEGRVHGYARLGRDFQDDNLPAAIVVVGEVIDPRDSGLIGNREVTRNLTVAVRLCVKAADEDAEDQLDALTVDVEKALVNGAKATGLKLALWKPRGAEQPSFAESGSEAGTLVGVTITYSCSVTTPDSAPDTNIQS